MTDIIEKELIARNNEKVSIERELKIHQTDFANKMLGGMGDKMLYELKNPPVPTKWAVLKAKIKRFFRRLFNTI
jgi:hypothetical protein